MFSVAVVYGYIGVRLKFNGKCFRFYNTFSEMGILGAKFELIKADGFT